MRIAYTCDLKDEEEQEYVQYLENRVETQSEIITLYKQLYQK